MAVQVSDEVLQQAVDLVAQYGSPHLAMLGTGIPNSTLVGRCRMAAFRGITPGGGAAPEQPAEPPAPSAKRPQSSGRLGRVHMVIPDVQAKPGVPLEHLSWAGQYIAEKRPDVIVCIGDFADMESLSSYDKGKRAAENRRYQDDIKAAKDAMALLMAPIKAAEGYDPRLVLTLGNHECYQPDTDVLTRRGWVPVGDVSVGEEVYTLSKSLKGEWQPVKAAATYPFAGELLGHSSRTVNCRVTPNHRMIWTNNNSGKIFEGRADESPRIADIFVSAVSGEGVDLSDAQIRYSAVAVTDSSFIHRQVAFYQSGVKADRIRAIIEDAGVAYTEKARDRDITHICGRELKSRPLVAYEFYMSRPAWCPDNNKTMPEWAYRLSERQFEVFLETLIFCDGTVPTKAVNSLVFYGKKEICDSLQALCVTKGYRATLTEYRENQWRVNITKTTLCRVEGFMQDTVPYRGDVSCVQVDNEIIMVRREGKPMFCGNSRITRFSNGTPEMHETVSISDLGYEEWGWEVYPFLDVVTIDGIAYSHYFYTPNTGRAYGGTAHSKLKNVGMSFTMGHQQGIDIAMRELADGSRQIGLVAGSFYQHKEEYRGPQANGHWHGLVLKNEVLDGVYDPCFVSLGYLRRRYG